MLKQNIFLQDVWTRCSKQLIMRMINDPLENNSFVHLLEVTVHKKGLDEIMGRQVF